MREPTYGEALSKAWKLVWNHHTLWVLGLLSLAVGHFGLNAFIGMLLIFADQGLFDPSIPWWPAALPVLHLPSTESLLWFIWLALVVSSILLFIVVVSMLAKGAIIAATGEWFRQHQSPNMRRAWRKGVKHFWRLLAVEILQKIGLGLILFVLIGSLRMVAGEGTFHLFLRIVGATIGLIAAAAVTSTTIYAAGYIVEEETGLGEALASGWHLFARHLLVSVETSCLLLLLNLLVIAIIYFFGVLTFVPSFLISAVGGLTGAKVLISIGVSIGGYLWIVVLALVGSIFNAYTGSVWMYLFMTMHHQGVASRILRWFERAAKLK